jgi:hypothetical protein
MLSEESTQTFVPDKSTLTVPPHPQAPQTFPGCHPTSASHAFPSSASHPNIEERLEQAEPKGRGKTSGNAHQRNWTVVDHNTDVEHLCHPKQGTRELEPKNNPVSTYDRERAGNGKHKRRLELRDAARSDTLIYCFAGKWPARARRGERRQVPAHKDCASCFELA